MRMIQLGAFLTYNAVAWHSHLHITTGIVQRYQLEANFAANKKRDWNDWLDRLMMVNHSGMQEDCKINCITIQASFPDQMKGLQSERSDWHYNDKSGLLTITHPKRKDTDPIPDWTHAEFRDYGWTDNADGAFCDPGAGAKTEECYGLPVETINKEVVTPHLGQRTGGIILRIMDEIFAQNNKMNFSEDYISAYSALYNMDWAMRFGLHFIGDSHQPLHSGTMFSNFGLHADCCPITTDKQSDYGRGCTPPDSDCLTQSAEGAFPTLYCRNYTDFDTTNGAIGDLGGNEIWFSYAGCDKFAAKNATTGVFHYFLDAGAQMFEDTTLQAYVDASNNPTHVNDKYVKCNTAANGTLRKYAYNIQEFDPAKKTVGPKQVSLDATEFYGAGPGQDVRAWSDNNIYGMLECHASHMVEDYPIDKIQKLLQDLFQLNYKLLFQTAYVDDANEAYKLKDRFNPLSINEDSIVGDTEFIRKNLLYKWIISKKFKGADCKKDWKTKGLAADDLWVQVVQSTMRGQVVLGGYRAALFVEGLDKYFDPVMKLIEAKKVPSPSDAKCTTRGKKPIKKLSIWDEAAE